jgi:hypothetical protein
MRITVSRDESPLEQIELVVEVVDSQRHQSLGKYGQFAVLWKHGRCGVIYLDSLYREERT